MHRYQQTFSPITCIFMKKEERAQTIFRRNFSVMAIQEGKRVDFSPEAEEWPDDGTPLIMKVECGTGGF
jgi:hypothetical protein